MSRVLSFLLSIFFCFGIMLQTLASEIPTEEMETIKKAFPEVNIRFDGLVELPDGTQYLPVFPMERSESKDFGQVIFTLPKDTKLVKKPDLIQFASNLSLFKIIRKKGENPTIISSDEIPLEVKLGLLPQDLLVPHNLEIPAELRIILGDLVIPIKESGEFKELSFKKTKNKNINNNEKNVSFAPTPDINASLKEYDSLINKDLYIINYDKNYVHVVNPEVGRPFKLFEIDSIPSDIKLTRSGKYFLVSALSRNKVYVIDATNGKFIKEIKVGDMPISIAIADRHHRAYVANKGDSTITVIDLKNMEAIDTFKVDGMPVSLFLTEEQKEMIYYDPITSNIYSLAVTDDSYSNYINRAIAKSSNISKVIKKKDKLYVISRSKNTLEVYNPYEGSLIKTIKVGKKPVDIKIVKNKIYVLNAQDDALSIIDINKLEVVKTVDLKTGGFPKNFDIMYNGKTALITNASAYEMLIYDIDGDEVKKRLPLSVNVNSLVVSKKLKQNENEDL